MYLTAGVKIEQPDKVRLSREALRRSRGEAELDAVQFLRLARAETKRLAMP